MGAIPEALLSHLSENTKVDYYSKVLHGKTVEPDSLENSIQVAKQGGNVARIAREELELRTVKKVVSPINAKKTLGSDEENTSDT